MLLGEVSPKGIPTKVVLEVAPADVNMIGIVLRAVVFNGKVFAVNAVVMPLAWFCAARPRKRDTF